MISEDCTVRFKDLLDSVSSQFHDPVKGEAYVIFSPERKKMDIIIKTQLIT